MEFPPGRASNSENFPEKTEFWVFTKPEIHVIIPPVLARWCSRLARQPVTLEVDGSSPFRVAKKAVILLDDCFFICYFCRISFRRIRKLKTTKAAHRSDIPAMIRGARNPSLHPTAVPADIDTSKCKFAEAEDAAGKSTGKPHPKRWTRNWDEGKPGMLCRKQAKGRKRQKGSERNIAVG